jgi:Ser/Thr protein kinase RdoA (MazF antagonist)
MLDTSQGRVFIKQIPDEVPPADLMRAQGVERRALAAGIEMPVQVAAASGVVADVAGLGLIRVHEWVGGRPLASSDDVSDWLGATLARLHHLQPVGRAEPQWYGLYPESQWRAWLAGGRRQHRSWAPVLEQRLGDVLAATAWIGGAFAAAGDYVLTHRDLEPRNVLMTGNGPVLVDWDTAGPDSASLEAGMAIIEFARHGLDEPDRDAVRRTAASYRRHGGAALGRGEPAGRDVLARRAGMLLNRLAERLRMTLGEQPPGSVDVTRAEARAADRLARLPGFLADLARWSELLDGPVVPGGRPGSNPVGGQ